MGTTGIAWSISEALPIRKTYKVTIHSSQEAITSKHSKGRGSSQANIEGYYKSGPKYVTLNIPIIYDASIFNPLAQYRFVIKEKDTTLVYLQLVPSFFKQKIKVDIITYEEEFITEKEIIEFLTVLLGI